MLSLAAKEYKELIAEEATIDAWSLSRYGRLDMLEVATPPDWGLGAAVTALGGRVQRLTHQDGFDISTDTGTRRVIQFVRKQMPRRVVMAPPCKQFLPRLDSGRSREETQGKRK